MKSKNVLSKLQVLLIVSTLGLLNFSGIEARLVLDEFNKQNRPALITTNHQFENPIIRVGGDDDSKTNQQIKTGMSILEATKCGKTPTASIALLVYLDGQTKTKSAECDGSLISDRYVLTTAYCIRLENKTLVSVRLGEYDTIEDTNCVGNEIKTKCALSVQEIDVEEAIYHKGFDPDSISFSGDIGLIRLKHKAVFDSNVMPICLPITSQSKVADKDWMFIAGWNRLDKDHKSTIPFKSIVPVIDSKTCEGIHVFIDLNEKHMCVGEDNVVNSYCKGDSGTPLLNTATYGNANGDESEKLRFVQYGIVSLYGSFCNSMLPHLYVKVEPYLTWIAGNIRN
ncbi:phenoloxidase-activating factor 3-like [Eupeodes corollae]|uniref:phenoloxidase-activating factor 3-like n=1 Tax=Eupeodes corollae TaxID=290404 RepID=UPI002491EFFC|nr:phenoloxidase-activating factor 3-like [Eupeodes corollae]